MNKFDCVPAIWIIAGRVGGLGIRGWEGVAASLPVEGDVVDWYSSSDPYKRKRPPDSMKWKDHVDSPGGCFSAPRPRRLPPILLNLKTQVRSTASGAAYGRMVTEWPPPFFRAISESIKNPRRGRHGGPHQKPRDADGHFLKIPPEMMKFDSVPTIWIVVGRVWGLGIRGWEGVAASRPVGGDVADWYILVTRLYAINANKADTSAAA